MLIYFFRWVSVPGALISRRQAFVTSAPVFVWRFDSCLLRVMESRSELFPSNLSRVWDVSSIRCGADASSRGSSMEAGPRPGFTQYALPLVESIALPRRRSVCEFLRWLRRCPSRLQLLEFRLLDKRLVPDALGC